ncbi:hypothetical protein Hanom_Chr16g01443831 [Helianthus anomalus]
MLIDQSQGNLQLKLPARNNVYLRYHCYGISVKNFVYFNVYFIKKNETFYRNQDVLKPKQSTDSFKIFKDHEEDQHVPMALEATEPEEDLIHTTEDVSVNPPSPAAARPSVVFSSKGDSGSPLQKLQSQVFRVLKGLSPPLAAAAARPLVHQRILKEPSRLFESMVVVGLHPNCDIQALQRQYFGRRPDVPRRFRSALSVQNQFRVEPNLEPQVQVLQALLILKKFFLYTS